MFFQGYTDQSLKIFHPLNSYIVPVYREFKEINHFLDSLFVLNHRENLIEVILVDGDSGTTLEVISQEHQQNPNLVQVISEKGRGLQLQFGANLAKGSRFIFLHCDTQLTQKCLDSIYQHQEGLGSFRLKFSEKHFWADVIASFTNLRSQIFEMPYGDQVYFLSKANYLRTGGFTNIPILEDVDFVKKCKRYFKVKSYPFYVYTSFRKYKGNCFKVVLKHRLIIILYVLGVSPKRIGAWFLK